MTKRSLLSVFVFTIITFGIYMIYWAVKTKGELNEKGAEVPSAWWIIVPIANIWWAYKYYEGAEKVTNEKINALLYFLLGFFITGLLPMLLCQNEYNKMGADSPPAEPQPAA